MKLASRVINRITSLMFPDPFLNNHTVPASDINLRNVDRHRGRSEHTMLLLP